jgi:hypothetical protein
MTANQLERFARAHRKVTEVDDDQARVRRRLVWRMEEDGSLSATLHLPPLEGAALLKALRAATGDLEHPHDRKHPEADGTGGVGGATDGQDAPAETPDANAKDVPAETRPTSSNLADALVAIAEAYLAGKVASADNPDVYQVIVHVGTDVTGPAETAEAQAQAADAPGNPADPGRCHVEDGPGISVSTADMLACDATLSWMLHDHDGTLLDVGRRSRKPSAALRRAARERDNCRCRFPGCESRRVDLHHIQFWSSSGKTKLTNLINLCRYHHRLVHERSFAIATEAGGTFTFRTPAGQEIPASPELPQTEGEIQDCHDAEILPSTIIPAWYGERLNLDYAIAACFACAEGRYENQAGQEPAEKDVWRPRLDVF